MKNIDKICELGFEDSVVFRDPDYDDAIIGHDINGRVVYDYEKMIDCLLINMCFDDAIDFIDNNTLRAIPYMGEKGPIVIKKFD